MSSAHIRKVFLNLRKSWTLKRKKGRKKTGTIFMILTQFNKGLKHLHVLWFFLENASAQNFKSENFVCGKELTFRKSGRLRRLKFTFLYWPTIYICLPSQTEGMVYPERWPQTTQSLESHKTPPQEACWNIYTNCLYSLYINVVP